MEDDNSDNCSASAINKDIIPGQTSRSIIYTVVAITLEFIHLIAGPYLFKI